MKKILTYMMTAILTLGCAGLSTPMTAYADVARDVHVHDFSTGENYVIHREATTPEQDYENYVKRCRGIGMNDAEIQAEWERYHGSSSSSPAPTAPESTPAPASSAVTSSVQLQSKPTYTQEQIDAAWEEAERTESTCVVAGSVVYKNSLTGATKTEELPLIEHDYQETENVAPTCTEDGHITKTCTGCGDVQTETIKATGHQAGEAIVATPAGWFSEGESVVNCTVCGEELSSEVIPQTSPLPLAAVIGIAVAVVALIAGVVFAVVRKKKSAVAE